MGSSIYSYDHSACELKRSVSPVIFLSEHRKSHASPTLRSEGELLDSQRQNASP
jgi:hypothetical protein